MDLFGEDVIVVAHSFRPCLGRKLEESTVFLLVVVKFKVDKELVIREVFECEEVHVRLFLLVDLLKAVVSHNALVEPARCKRI